MNQTLHIIAVGVLAISGILLFQAPAFGQAPPLDAAGVEAQAADNARDIERTRRQLEQIAADYKRTEEQLARIGSELKESNRVVGEFDRLITSFRTYQDSQVNFDASCRELTLSAEALKADGVRTWERFAQRAEECQASLQQADRLLQQYQHRIDEIQKLVDEISRSTSALQQERDLAINEQLNLENQRKLVRQLDGLQGDANNLVDNMMGF